MIKISIILPLFNAEKYLEESLQSILAQTLQEFEIICINDDSKDKTGIILQKYKDARLKILSNETHLGAAKSRNKGLMEAKGKYITFLDGDDIFDENMLLLAYLKAELYKTDIVEYSYKIISSDYIHNKTKNKHSKNYIERFCKNTFSISELTPSEFMICHSAPWNKLYRRKFILKEKIIFQDLSCCNDVFFVNMALFLAKKIIFLDENNIMVYVRNHNTPTRISYDRDPMNAYWADIGIAEELKKREKMELFFNQFYFRVLCHFIETLNMTKNEEKARDFYFFLQCEGIKKLRNFAGDKYLKLQNYVRDGLEKFEKQSFESQWFKNKGEYYFFLEENIDRIKSLFCKWKRNNLKVGLWGAGKNGRAFLHFCKQNKLYVDTIVDIDENKWGESIYNFSPVCNPQNNLKKVQIILLTNSNFEEEIVSVIESKQLNIKVVNINTYLGR